MLVCAGGVNFFFSLATKTTFLSPLLDRAGHETCCFIPTRRRPRRLGAQSMLCMMNHLRLGVLWHSTLEGRRVIIIASCHRRLLCAYMAFLGRVARICCGMCWALELWLGAVHHLSRHLPPSWHIQNFIYTKVCAASDLRQHVAYMYSLLMEHAICCDCVVGATLWLRCGRAVWCGPKRKIRLDARPHQPDLRATSRWQCGALYIMCASVNDCEAHPSCLAIHIQHNVSSRGAPHVKVYVQVTR